MKTKKLWCAQIQIVLNEKYIFIRRFMTEERYQYLNSLPLKEYDRETSSLEQEEFCNYQRKHHPDEVIYYQIHNFDSDREQDDYVLNRKIRRAEEVKAKDPEYEEYQRLKIKFSEIDKQLE